MNELTQKQENFCLAYIETGNASEAYRKAYNAAEIARGKAAGLYVEQSRTEGEIRIVWAGT